MYNRAIGSLTYNYAYLLKNGRKEADNLLCKLSWLDGANDIIDGYIPVGTLISTPEVPACGLTNTVIGFAPVLWVNLVPTVFNYNGNPVAIGSNYTTLELFLDDAVAALTNTSGVQWSWTQVGTYEFKLCAPYTQNGDTVDIALEAFLEASIGFIRMAVELEGGVAPETPARYQTAGDNCITITQYNDMVEMGNTLTRNVKFCDIAKPLPQVCDPNAPSEENVELREIGNKELREDGN